MKFSDVFALQNIKSIKVTLLSACIILAACSSVPMYEERHVLKAKNTGGLYTLYAQMENELAQEKPSSERAENIRQYRHKVGEEIAIEKEQTLLNTMGRDLSQHSISKLNKAKQDAADIQSYNETIYLALISQLDEEIHNKEKAVAAKQAEYEQLGLLDSARKMQLLAEMVELTGGEQGQALQAKRDAYLSDLLADAKAQMQVQKYEQVVVILDQIEKLDPQFPGLQDMRYALIEAEYEQQFWDALSAADKQKSYELLKKLTAIPNYLQKKSEVVDIVKHLQNLFLEDAARSMASMSIVSAYSDFSRANFIQQQLGEVKSFSEAERQFIRVMENKFLKAQEAGEIVKAYGFLSIIEELEDDNALIEEHAPTVNNALLQQATVKVLPKPLNSKVEDKELAKVFADALAKRLQDIMKAQVEVYPLERQSSLLALSERANPSAWFEVSGELLQAEQSSDSKAEQEVRNVLVSYQTVENPEYVAWSQLSKRQRKEKAEPAITIEKPVHKDVTINKVLINKHVKLNASYRLIDQQSKSVLFFSSQEAEQSAEGVVQKAIKEGLFELEAQDAQLPLDADLLGQTIADAVVGMADQLKPELEKLDARYTKAAELAFIDQAYTQAAEQFAYADVLAKSKKKTLTEQQRAAEIAERMRYSMMRWK